MTKQEQIEEMCEAIASMICQIYNPQCNEYEPHTCSHCYANDTLIGDFAEMLYNAGYRKTFTSDLASDTQKAFKEGYEKARKETAKEIFQKVVNICRKEEDFQDGTVNTQLEPLYFGIMNGCAFIRGEVKELAEQYGVEVEE